MSGILQKLDESVLDDMLARVEGVAGTEGDVKPVDYDRRPENYYSHSRQLQIEETKGKLCCLNLYTMTYLHVVRGSPLPFVNGGEGPEQPNGFRKRRFRFHTGNLQIEENLGKE